MLTNKILKKILFFLTLLSYNLSNAQIVDIPDVIFKNRLLNIYDSNNDGEIQISEIENLTTLSVNNLGIHDLTGIEYFTNLSTLNCQHNLLKTLDVSNNKNLRSLGCHNNLLTSININSNLEHFDCSHNLLTTLDVSNTNLIDLFCISNSLTTLNISNCDNLHRLCCPNNSLTTLNINNLPSLKVLSCQYNLISTLDSNNPNLSFLNCENNLLKSINVSSNLDRFFCSNNLLSTLDVSSYTNLDFFSCSNNLFTTLDVSNNTNLIFFTCSDNLINTLDVSNSINLTHLKCENNINLEYLNLKNGNNENFGFTISHSGFENLPNLQNVCVDLLNTDLTEYILTETGHSVNFLVDCSTLITIENKFIEFSIYPTPTENILKIKSKTEILKIEIYSKLGQLIKETTKNKIDISNLTQDLYFVKVKDINGNIGMKKILKK